MDCRYPLLRFFISVTNQASHAFRVLPYFSSNSFVEAGVPTLALIVRPISVTWLANSRVV